MNLIEQLIASGMFPSIGGQPVPVPGMLTNPGFPGMPPVQQTGADVAPLGGGANESMADRIRRVLLSASGGQRPDRASSIMPETTQPDGGARFGSLAPYPAGGDPVVDSADPNAKQGRPGFRNPLRGLIGPDYLINPESPPKTAPASFGPAPYPAGGDPVVDSGSPTAYPQGGDPVIDGTPLPRARPTGANAPTDISSANREAPGAPADIVPSPQQLLQSSAPPPAANPTSIFDKLMSGLGDRSNQLIAMGAGFAGAPNIGQGLSRAGAAVLPAREADFKRSQLLGAQQSKLNALLKAGVPNEQAIAAMYDPKLMEQLSARYLTDPKAEIKTITDSLGNQSLVAVNPYDLTTKDVTPGANASDATPSEGMSITAAAGLRNAAKLPPSYDPTTHRDEAFLNALDPLTKSAVQDIADGKMPSTGRNMQKMMPLVSRYELGFDNTQYQRRQALEKSYYGGGEGFKALRSANTTIDHGIQLKKAIDDLHNFSVLPGVLNPVTGAISKQYNQKYQAALKEFKANAELYSKELDFALTGKSTVSGTNHLREMFDPNASPTENRASLHKTLEMLQERINEHENSYRTGMNKNGEVFKDMLTKRDELQRLLGEDPASGRSEAAPAAHGTALPAGKTANGFSWSVQP